MIRFRPAVNLSNRKLKTQEDITPENVHLIKDAVLTLRVIVGILAAIYDPLGLISALTICYKIQLGLLHKKEVKWDEHLAEETARIWKDLLKAMVLMPDIQFHCSAQPHNTT